MKSVLGSYRSISLDTAVKQTLENICMYEYNQRYTTHVGQLEDLPTMEVFCPTETPTHAVRG